MAGETGMNRGWTTIGLVVALVGLPTITLVWRLLVPDPHGAGSIVLREISILVMVGLLLWLVVAGEKQPLSSIGIGPTPLWRSLAWGLACAALMVIGIGVAIGVMQLLDLHQDPSGARIAPSLWVATLVVIRAGIAEEICYRGYAMTRIESLTGSRWIAAAIPLGLFAAFHFRLGAAGMLIALILGAILTGFFMWRRNLIANMFAHFLIDFVPNVLLASLSDH
jgi:membrane protease YdiL (CAAX protease family)